MTSYSVNWVKGAFQVEENFDCWVMMRGTFQADVEGWISDRRSLSLDEIRPSGRQRQPYEPVSVGAVMRAQITWQMPEAGPSMIILIIAYSPWIGVQSVDWPMITEYGLSSEKLFFQGIFTHLGKN